MRFIGGNGLPKKEVKAVASGTMPNGKPVVVNADGTVSVVAESSLSQSTGSPTAFNANLTAYLSAVYDPDTQQVIVAYRANTGYGEAIVGTVSGTSISFGTPVVFQSSTSLYVRSAYDTSAQKVAIAFVDGAGGANLGKVVVGTVSGTSISFGSAVTFDGTSVTNYLDIAYDTNAQKVVVAYKSSAGGYGKAVVGTIDGTTITYGSLEVFQFSTANWISCAYDANAQKVVIAYQNEDTSRGTAKVGTVSGTSISFGSGANFDFQALYNSIVYDPNTQKVVISYAANFNSNYGTSIVGTVSGTSISFGTPVVFESASVASSWYIGSAYDSNAQKVVVAYRDVGNSNHGTVVVGTVSGTSISFNTPAVFEAASIDYATATYVDSARRVVIPYQGAPTNYYGTYVVFRNAGTYPNLTASNYIGMSQSGAVNGQVVGVGVKGTVDGNQSGLTPGRSYYVQSDGTISTTAGAPSVFAGTSISATKLVVKG